MSPEEMVGYMNGAAPAQDLFFAGAWHLMAASPAFDAALTDWAMIEHHGGGGDRLALFAEGVIIRWDGDTARWTVDRSGEWRSPDGRLHARFDPLTHHWQRVRSPELVASAGSHRR